MISSHAGGMRCTLQHIGVMRPTFTSQESSVTDWQLWIGSY
jgi:hypothetical protein